MVKPVADWATRQGETLALLAGAAEVTFDENYVTEKGTPASVTMMGELYMPLEGLVDVEAEKARLDKEIAKVQQELGKSEAKLGNPNFVDRAKPEVVAKERARLVEWQEKINQLQEMRKSLT